MTGVRLRGRFRAGDGPAATHAPEPAAGYNVSAYVDGAQVLTTPFPADGDGVDSLNLLQIIGRSDPGSAGSHADGIYPPISFKDVTLGTAGFGSVDLFNGHMTTTVHPPWGSVAGSPALTVSGGVATLSPRETTILPTTFPGGSFAISKTFAAAASIYLQLSVLFGEAVDGNYNEVLLFIINEDSGAESGARCFFAPDAAQVGGNPFSDPTDPPGTSAMSLDATSDTDENTVYGADGLLDPDVWHTIGVKIIPNATPRFTHSFRAA